MDVFRDPEIILFQQSLCVSLWDSAVPRVTARILIFNFVLAIFNQNEVDYLLFSLLKFSLSSYYRVDTHFV